MFPTSKTTDYGRFGAWNEIFLPSDTISPLDSTFGFSFDSSFLQQPEEKPEKEKERIESKCPTREEYKKFLELVEKFQREELMITQHMQERFYRIQEGDIQGQKALMEDRFTKESMREVVKVMKEKLRFFIKFCDALDPMINPDPSDIFFETSSIPPPFPSPFSTNSDLFPLKSSPPLQPSIKVEEKGKKGECFATDVVFPNFPQFPNFPTIPKQKERSRREEREGEEGGEDNESGRKMEKKSGGKKLVGERKEVEEREEREGEEGKEGNEGEMVVTVQPTPQIVANRYISPPPEVRVRVPRSGDKTYLVVVRIVYYGTQEEVLRTTAKGKKNKGEPILEGINQLPLGSNETETITFHKLKLSEVSSKHNQKPFAMLFSVESKCGKNQKGGEKGEEKRALITLLSEPFYVQSRAIKKRTLPLERRTDLSQQLPFSQLEDKKLKLEIESGDSKWVDITPLLVFPQKKAAKMLAISESMMCKKWKEATDRKWPFRAVQKYNKLIKQLKKEDESKNAQQIEELFLKKKQVLLPVSISLSIDKTLPPFPPLNIDNLETFGEEEEEGEDSFEEKKESKKKKKKRETISERAPDQNFSAQNQMNVETQEIESVLSLSKKKRTSLPLLNNDASFLNDSVSNIDKNDSNSDQ